MVHRRVPETRGRDGLQDPIASPEWNRNFSRCCGEVSAYWFVSPLMQTRANESKSSDTTRASLIAIWWYLSKYPEHADKVYSEIKNVDVRDANALATLPHLNGVVNEILRLVPPAMTGGSRITGPEGLLIDGTLIPPFTKVMTPKYVVMRCMLSHCTQSDPCC